MKKANCRGCVDDFYNKGNNPYGVVECWSFSTAQLVRRQRIGIWDTPPHTTPPEELPSCFRQKGFIFKTQT